MRKILTFPRNGIAALKVVAGSAARIALCAGIAGALCLTGIAQAQTLAQHLVPTTMSVQDSPISGEFPTVDASYSVMSDETQVEPASFLRGGTGGYCPPSTDICNQGANLSWYLNYDALWLRRERDERFSLSQNSFLPDFQYEFGGRFTIGRLLDSVNGWEAVYTGPYDWQRSGTVAGAANLQSQFQPLNGYTASEVSSFNSADQHVQAYRAQLNSFEINRRWWVWDVVSTMIGVRFIDYEEDYLFLSTRTGVGTGLFTEGVDNQLAGAQFGANLFYPVSLRANVGFRGKAGVYANFSERRTFLSNAGTTVINAGDSQVDVAGLIEMGVFTNYHIVPSIRLTAGYEFWYMPGMATIAEQGPSLISPASGTTVSNGDNVFLHGGSVGLQILF